MFITKQDTNGLHCKTAYILSYVAYMLIQVTQIHSYFLSPFLSLDSLKKKHKIGTLENFVVLAKANLIKPPMQAQEFSLNQKEK